MRYLADWRMQLAKQMMREGSGNIQEVATRVGYESEAAFNRAFKCDRLTGGGLTQGRASPGLTSVPRCWLSDRIASHQLDRPQRLNSSNLRAFSNVRRRVRWNSLCTRDRNNLERKQGT